MPAPITSPSLDDPSAVTSVPNELLIWSQTPMPSRTRYSTATAIIQMKNPTTASTAEILNVAHGSIRRICTAARSAVAGPT
ncbi:Uncharacterised protein [Mycobacteroides abscessus subsp. abscessus]|nr:Uncharacterised protein [Mycobacteroides abscessus subsp. abscessus]